MIRTIAFAAVLLAASMTQAYAGVFLVVASPAQKQVLFSYNDPSCDADTGFTGMHQTTTNSAGYCMNPRDITAPAPYAYAGKSLMSPNVNTNPNYVNSWAYTTNLPIAEIDPAEAWPCADTDPDCQ